MIEYDKVPYTQLKKIVVDLNESGLLTTNLRHVAVKGPKLYDDFITSVEGLDNETKAELPENVIDFYNHVQEFDEEEPEPLQELNFESDILPEQPPDYEPEKEIEDELTAMEVVEVNSEEFAALRPEDDEQQKEKEPIKEPEKREPNLTEKPKKTLKRLSKIVMTPKVEDGKLTISFKSLNISETFDLPEIEDKTELKVARKAAMDYAIENGATKGQCCNISKTLNIAGYYAR